MLRTQDKKAIPLRRRQQPKPKSRWPPLPATVVPCAGNPQAAAAAAVEPCVTALQPVSAPAGRRTHRCVYHRSLDISPPPCSPWTRSRREAAGATAGVAAESETPDCSSNETWGAGDGVGTARQFQGQGEGLERKLKPFDFCSPGWCYPGAASTLCWRGPGSWSMQPKS